jgi:hypothetical protein
MKSLLDSSLMNQSRKKQLVRLCNEEI